MGLKNWNRIFSATWALVALATTLVQTIGLADEYFVFTSFRGNGEDGLHLALSTNGYQWQALKGDRSFLSSEFGAKLIRDPCLAEGTRWAISPGLDQRLDHRRRQNHRLRSLARSDKLVGTEGDLINGESNTERTNHS